jgi:hypothetical protein
MKKELIIALSFLTLSSWCFGENTSTSPEGTVCYGIAQMPVNADGAPVITERFVAANLRTCGQSLENGVCL